MNEEKNEDRLDRKQNQNSNQSFKKRQGQGQYGASTEDPAPVTNDPNQIAQDCA